MRSPMICALCLFFLMPLSAWAQNGGHFKKANTLFQAKNYGAAIPYWQRLLAADSVNYQVMSKLAYSYMMTNRQVRAAELYQRLDMHDKIRPADRLHYATCLFYLGLYDDAEEQAKRFLTDAPDNPKALSLINACRSAPTIQPLFPQAVIEPIAVNSPADDNSPVVMDGYLYFSSDRPAGFNPLKEKSGSTGREYIRIYRIPLKELETGRPQPVGKLNTTNLNTSSLTYSSDDNEVIYCQNSVTESKSGAYNLQLYRADKDRFNAKSLLPFVLNDYNYMHPNLSPDGRELVFVSDRNGGAGGTDIYYTVRTSKGWSKPVPISEQINTPDNEGFPFIDAEGRLFFCSKGHSGLGGYDIFMSIRHADGEWQKPVNLGAPFNSAADDISFMLLPDGQSGFFTTTRREGHDDIYRFWLTQEAVLGSK